MRGRGLPRGTMAEGRRHGAPAVIAAAIIELERLREMAARRPRYTPRTITLRADDSEALVWALRTALERIAKPERLSA